MDPRLTTPELTPLPIGHIRNCHAIGGIIIASQPAPEDFKTFRDMGVTSVLNNRHASELDFDEAELVRGLAMTYVHVPWTGPDQLTDQVIEDSVAFFRDAPRPILAHCQACNRTGAMWLAHRVINDKIPWPQAVEEAHRAGLTSKPYEHKIKNYINHHQP